MNTFLIILFIILIILISSGIIYITLYNKINDIIIRVNEVENRIDNNLRDKYDLLNKTATLYKSKIDIDDKTFNTLSRLKSKKMSSFDFDRVLVDIENNFLTIYENNKELRESDEIYKTQKKLEIITEELVTLRNYYNINIATYNKMIKKFPTLIIAMIKKYKEKPFYDLKNMNDDNYEDFKL